MNWQERAEKAEVKLEHTAKELERIAEEIPLFLMKRNMAGVLMDCKKLENLAKELKDYEHPRKDVSKEAKK